MNCSDCRRSVHPYLDDELEVRDHVTILEHLDRCAPCRVVYDAEGRIRGRLKESLAKDRCPARVAVAFAKSMRGERLKDSWLRYVPAAVAVAATLVAAIVLRDTLSSNEPSTFDPWSVGADAPPLRLRHASRFVEPGRCPRTSHGPFVAWASDRYDELVKDRVDASEGLCQGHVASWREAGRNVLCPEVFFDAAREAVGKDVCIPKAFLEGGQVVGGELLMFEGRVVPEVIVAFPDREVVIYDMPKECGAPGNLYKVNRRDTSPKVLHTCPECDVVVVSCAERTIVLISRQLRDWSRHWIYEKASTF